MDSEKPVALLEEKLMRLIEQNVQIRREQERFGRELEKRDKRIGELDRTLKKVQRDHKAAKGKLDKIIEKLEAFT